MFSYRALSEKKREGGGVSKFAKKLYASKRVGTTPSKFNFLYVKCKDIRTNKFPCEKKRGGGEGRPHSLLPTPPSDATCLLRLTYTQYFLNCESIIK